MTVENVEHGEPHQGGEKLQRTLKNRHIQLIAIGGAIGTGLFMGSGKTISVAGPSILLVYMIIGAVLFLFMRTLGELLLSDHKYATFADIARDLIGPWAGFVTGWTYWACWVVTGVADMIAITGYTHFWWPDLPAWIPIGATTLLLFALNAMTVKAFGETEFWFALFQIALFAFIGIEMVGTTVAETDDPDNTLPKAVNSIPVRIMLFYVAALAAIMMVTPWDQVSPERSPFVTMFSLTGLGAAATIVNLVVLSSAASSANSGIYSTSRMLYGLARQEQAPGVFARLSSHHVPLNALFLSCVCLLSGIVIMGMGGSISEAFTLVTSVSATLFMGVWVVIVVSYLVYLHKHPQLHAASKFKAPGGAISAWIVLAFMGCMGVILAMWDDTRPGLVYSLIWIVFIVGAAFANRHFLLRRAARGVLGDGGTGEGPHTGPHLHE